MEAVIQDVRHSLQRLARTPTFTAVAIITLALGIGMTTAVYTVVDQSVLRPFPYPDIDRMVVLREESSTGHSMSVSWPNFQDWKSQNEALQELGIYRSAAVNLTGSGQPERLNASIVSASVFDTAGIAPLRGRVLSAADDRPGSDRVAVISERLWRTHFGGAPDIVGQSVTLNQESHTIVGVMPPTMRFPSRLTDIWLSLGPYIDTFPKARDNHPGLTAIGRLKPSVTIDAARSAMAVIAARLSTQYPDSNHNSRIVVQSYNELMVQGVRPVFRLLLGAVGLVLILACANLANLMLARAESRQRELAVRGALGAGRWRLVRQLMTEAAVLGMAGGAAGVAVAYWTVAAFLASHPTTIPRVDLIRVDPWILLFVLGLTILTSVLFGTVPALRGSRARLQDALRSGRDGFPGTSRLRDVLVAAEVAIALMLLVGTGLLGRSLSHVLSLDLGFDPSHTVTLELALPQASYPTLEAWTAFHRSLLARLSGAPAVESVGLSTSLPLSGNAAESSLMREGDPMPTRDHPPAECTYSAISPDYFQTMGVRVIRGRGFDTHDASGAVPVAIIDDTVVARLFADRDPIGERIAFEFRGDSPSAPQPIWREIVGVVPHIKQYGLTGEPPYVQIFVPYEQLPLWMQDRRPALSLVVRTKGTSEAMVGTVRQAVGAINRDIPVYGVQTMDEAIGQAVEQPRVSLALFAAFATLALVIAVVGLYGVLSHAVALRTREIGLRMALGARRGQIAQLVTRQAVRLVGLGLVLGVVGAVGLSRFLGALLVDVSPTDPVTLAVVVATLVLVAGFAAAIPTRRASSVDPLVALRE